ncbi:hypothetical protein AYI70_g9947 [Smittium culicis]|uniref:Uncharacterized protein n=1 Tax=Smittium culicis TaxID=133412 RepID=A0A1R1X8U4_9FUNG|nr:hypothetical protein AYI70_g9947 [Smittium culicis]
MYDIVAWSSRFAGVGRRLPASEDIELPDLALFLPVIFMFCSLSDKLFGICKTIDFCRSFSLFFCTVFTGIWSTPVSTFPCSPMFIGIPGVLFLDCFFILVAFLLFVFDQICFLTFKNIADFGIGYISYFICFFFTVRFFFFAYF